MIDLLSTIGLAIGCGIMLGLLHEAFYQHRNPLRRRGFNVSPGDVPGLSRDRADRRLARLTGKRP